MIDLILLVLLLGYGISGFRQGAVVGILSVGGFLGGAAAAMWIVPALLPQSLSAADANIRRVILILAAVMVCATIGQAIAVAGGVRLRSRVRLESIRLVDSIFGAVASMLAVALLVGLVAGAVRNGPSPPLSRAVAESTIVSAINRVLPSGSGKIFAGFRGLLDAEGFPKVFEGFGPESIRPVVRRCSERLRE
jgi:uncharacterized membrane protein required for colicin V production